MAVYERNKWLESSSRSIRIFFDDGMTYPLYSEDIVQESLNIVHTLSDETNLRYGKCSSSCLKISTFNTDESYIGKRMRVVIDTDESVLPFGTYTVYSDERSSNKMHKQIVAYDDMFVISTTDVAAWYNNLKFPMTVKQFRTSFFDFFGIQEVETELLFDDMLIDKTIYAEQISGLDVIQSICEINACFGQINEYGEFEYVTLNKPSEFTDENTFYPYEYEMNGLAYDDFVTQPITKVVIRQMTNDVGGGYGEDGNVLAIEDNFLAYGKSSEELIEMARLIYERVKDNCYTPSSLKLPFQPHMEMGDYVKVITPNEEEIVFPILYRAINGIIAIKEIYQARGEKNYPTQATTSIEKKIVQLQGKYNQISNTVDGLEIEIKKISAPDIGGRNLILNSKTLSENHDLLTEYLLYNDEVLMYNDEPLYI